MDAERYEILKVSYILADRLLVGGVEYTTSFGPGEMRGRELGLKLYIVVERKYKRGEESCLVWRY